MSVKSIERITKNVEYIEEIKQVVNNKISNLDENLSAKINEAESKIAVLTPNSSFKKEVKAYKQKYPQSMTDLLNLIMSIWL